MIEFHADDYGMTIKQSKRIIECIDNGVLNGISLMPNSPNLDECMNLLQNRDVKIAIHFNFCEGKCLSEEKIIAKSGNFEPNFIKLLLVSYIPFKRKKYKNAFKKEIEKQIEAVSKYYTNKPYRIDSHCHYHMLPVIFDALMEVIEEKKMDVEYIRIPIEKKLKIKPKNVPFVNRIKNLILKILYKRDKFKNKKLIKYGNQEFLGILFSGHMFYESVNVMLQNKLDNIEILFHPGAIYEKEDMDIITNKFDLEFLTSPNRQKEGEATIKIKNDLEKM